ncbi:MAG: sensor histidine kinase, partial [Gemmatimonadota bacterium]
ADHLLQLVDGVLELARLDAGDIELDLARARPEELIRLAVDDAAPVAEESGGSIDVRIPARLPALTTDPARLERALRLALLAAVRASPGASIAVVARTDHDAVVFEIRGTRLALDAHSPERVFGDFDDAPAGEEPLGRTGLRLSIALRLARRLGGDLRIRPADDSSSTVTMRLTDAPLLVEASSGQR